MKKSTGLLLLISFLVLILVLVAVFVTLVVYMLQGSASSVNILGGKRLALVRIENVIFDAEEWIDQIEKYQKDSSVRGIILRIDSPGGAVGPSQDLHDAVKTAREEYGKVVVASFASVAASGGYYIACGADHIVTTPGTLTGSIGVYTQFLKAKELFDKIGIDYETVKAGEYKTAGSMHRELTSKERAMFEGVIGDTYDQFLEAVIDGRRDQLISFLNHTPKTKYVDQYPFTSDVVEIIKEYREARDDARMKFLERMAAKKKVSQATPAEGLSDSEIAEATVASATIESVTKEEALQDYDEDTDEKKFEFVPSDETIYKLAKSLAEGKIYTGRQAKQLALVDSLGTMDDAIDIAARLSGIRGEPTVIEKKQRELTFFELLTSKLETFVEEQSTPPLMYKFEY